MLKKIYLFFSNIMWRKKNKHNATTISSKFPLDSVSVGNQTYGDLNIRWITKDDRAQVKIGNYCSIGPDVKFLVGGEHNYHRVSTFPFQTKVYGQVTKKNINRDIIIEDDVWIGYDALIMSGAYIGQGAVIGARAIVTKRIPPYSIFVNGKIIKYRFNDKIVEELKKIDFERINHKLGDDYSKYCQTEITEENIMEIIEKFNK